MLCNIRNAIQGCSTAPFSSWFCCFISNPTRVRAAPPPICLSFAKQSLRVQRRDEVNAYSVSHTRALRAAVLSAGQSVSWAPPLASLFSFRGLVHGCSLRRPERDIFAFYGFAPVSSRSRLVLFIKLIALLRNQMPSASFPHRANPAFKRTAPGGLPLLASPATVAPVAAA